jgi:hypothetical protein
VHGILFTDPAHCLLRVRCIALRCGGPAFFSIARRRGVVRSPWLKFLPSPAQTDTS